MTGPWTVYKHLTDDVVTYVGVTNNIERRNKEHRESSTLRPDTRVVEIATFTDHGEALACEAAIIGHYQPRNNRRGMYSGVMRGRDFLEQMASLRPCRCGVRPGRPAASSDLRPITGTRRAS